MTFFYDLNKRLADLASKQDAQQLAEHSVPATQQPKKGSLAQALNERDLGKHNNATTGFAALARKTGGGEKGARIAGAQLAKMRAKGQVEERDGLVEVTGDKPFDKMMGNIVKGAGALKKKSSNDKFEQVYDRVEVLLLQGGVHSYLEDDIPDALEKLKIKPTDELIAKLETAFLDRASGVLNFYNQDDMEESQQGMAEAINETEYPGQLDTSKLILKSIRHTGGDSHPGSPGYFDGPVYDNSGQYIGDLGFFPGGKLSSGNYSLSSKAVLSVKNPRDPHLQDYWEKMGKDKIGYGNFPLDYKITDLNDPLMKQAISQVEKLKQGVSEDQLSEIGDTPKGKAAIDSYRSKAQGQAAWAGGVAKALGARRNSARPEDPKYRDSNQTDPNADYGPEGNKYAKLSQKRGAGIQAANRRGSTAPAQPYDFQRQGGYGDKTNPAIKGVAEAVPNSDMAYDRRATTDYALKMQQALRDKTTAPVNLFYNPDNSITLVVNPRSSQPDATGYLPAGDVGATMKNVDSAIDSYYRMFRQKGWMFQQPREGRITFGVPAQPAATVAEGHCPECDCSPCECNSMEESAFQAAIGKKKYGDAGMKALQKAGRKHAGAETMSNIRNRYDKYDESQGMADEGNAFSKAVVDAKRNGIQKGEKIRVGGKMLPLKEIDMNLLKAAQGGMKGSNTDTESERNRHKKYGYRSDREDTGNDDDYDEHGNLKNQKKAAVSDGPKKKGRPTKEKRPERVTAKSYKYKDGRPTKTKEGLDSDGVMMTRPSNMSSEGYNPSEYDQEGEMVKGDMHTVIRHAEQLEQHLQDADNLPTWVIEKIGQIKGMMTSVSDYIISSHEQGAEQGIREPELDEEKVEAGKREFFDRLAPAARKAAKVIKVMSRGKEDTRAERAGKEDTKAERAGKKVTKDIEYDDKKDRKAKKDYDGDGKIESGKDEHSGSVDKAINANKKGKKAGKEEKVDETTTAGSVATATPSGKSGKGSMSFGKGVYEHYNRQFTQAMTESISIDSKMQECGNGNMEPGITITADGEEAAQLMMLLKLAGLESQIPQPCPTCGSSPCGCADMVDENSPDWPTNTETLAADPNLRTYSGGLNGPKSTGQSTTPVLAGQLRRQTSMEESVALERSLFRTWKNYKG